MDRVLRYGEELAAKLDESERVRTHIAAQIGSRIIRELDAIDLANDAQQQLFELPDLD